MSEQGNDGFLALVQMAIAIGALYFSWLSHKYQKASTILIEETHQMEKSFGPIPTVECARSFNKDIENGSRVLVEIKNCSKFPQAARIEVRSSILFMQFVEHGRDPHKAKLGIRMASVALDPEGKYSQEVYLYHAKQKQPLANIEIFVNGKFCQGFQYKWDEWSRVYKPNF